MKTWLRSAARPFRLAIGCTAVATAALAIAGMGNGGCRRPAPEATPAPPGWQILASELPSALLSVAGTGPGDIYAVGADKGRGPLVLHYDGARWSSLETGQRGDLWWVQAFPDHAAVTAGSSGMILVLRGNTCERLKTPGLGRQTVYGVWGKSAQDFYAVGSAAGRDGFVWHFVNGAFEDEAVPADGPRLSGGETPGFFKVFGRDDDVWVVGAGGTVLHRRGAAPFTLLPAPTKDTLFTVHGGGRSLLAVGGAGNGVLLESEGGAFRDVSPPGAGLLQGVFSGPAGDWASGERGVVYARPKGAAAFAAVDHGLVLPPSMSLHSIFVDAAGGVWSAGGNVLSPALDGGVLLHFGPPVSPVVLDDEGAASSAAPTTREKTATCPASVVAAGRSGSIARRWDEQALAAIRRDLPRPTVHARNLFHVSAAMWDVWAGYDARAAQVFAHEKRLPPPGPPRAAIATERAEALSYAAYDVLFHRYEHAAGGPETVACLRAVMHDLGYDPDDEHTEGSDAIAFGHRVARAVLDAAADDGANEAHDYEDSTSFVAANPPLAFDLAGAPLREPTQWQPLNLSIAATQNGIVLPAGVQSYVGAQWGSVRPFAMKRASPAVPWHDPGKPPELGPALTGWVVEVIRKTAQVDPQDPTTIDISPGAYGHNSLGANDGKGWSTNPVTGAPYPPQLVKLADFARVMAEFWADGPKSETPPGHWNVLANAVSDAPEATHRLFGRGEPLDRLAWDVRLYLALNGAEHDAAIAAWDVKRRFTTVRPISLIRWMAGRGQSSDPSGPSYDAMGLPLIPGLIEIITNESIGPGQRHAHLAAYVGQIAVRDWRGEPGDRTAQASGVGWVRGVEWATYQRRTFVTPAFPGFVSGHSTFSRAGAEVLASLTGSPYFPGGYAEFVARQGAFLVFERGPTADVRLAWASYFDAADEAGQSRIWGGIHIAPDDFAGRRIGHRVGLDAVALARQYFDGVRPERPTPAPGP
ncbi:MAG TPA: vanadium-dependent haloperoxidase [Polyangiaceae bacterium]|jgi:hypothetical protein|nr:vanadium-dependent haloperoxidase [Polyangiaceae bacterium]